MKICNYYGVTLDYLVKGSSGISNNAMIIAVKYEHLDKHGRELVEFVVNHEVERAKQTNGYDISSTEQGLGEPVQNQEIHQCHTRRTNKKMMQYFRNNSCKKVAQEEVARQIEK